MGAAFPPDSPHNWILQALVVGGVCVLIPASALVVRGVMLVRRALANREPGEPRGDLVVGVFAGACGYGTALLFHLTSPATTIPAAALCGLAVALPPKPAASTGRAKRSVPPPAATARVVAARTVAAAAAVVLAILFGGAAVAELDLRNAVIDASAGRLADADHAFGLARSLRPWDDSVDAEAFHAFASLSGSGDQQAIEYSARWQARLGSQATDEQSRLDAAVVLDAQGRDEEAAAVLSRLLRIDPANPLVHLRRGIVFAKLHRTAAAAHDFRLAAAASPQSPEPWRNLALLYGTNGQPAQARAAARRAAELSRHH